MKRKIGCMTRTLRWGAIVLAACVIAPASLFVHDYMLTALNVPYPKEMGLPIWASVFGVAVRLAGLVALGGFALPILKRGPHWLVACAIGVIILMLNETLRVIIVETTIVGSWPYAIMDGAPKAIATFLEVSIVAWAFVRGTRWPLLMLIIALVAIVGVVFVSPWLNTHFGNWRAAFGDIRKRYSVPYPPKVMFVIYATFLEATIAAFVIAASCWERLSGGMLRRIATFTLLLLLVRGRVVSLLLFSFWVRQPLPMAFLAESQFFLETMTLGLLVGTTWGLAKIYLSPGISRSAA
jgi:hypothetical protein